MNTGTVIVLVAALCGCADGSAPTLEELGNTTYRGVEEAGGPVTLVNGRWEGKPYAEGGASRPSVTLARDFRLAGDIDGDGREETVALLVAGTGGTGEMVYLAVTARSGAGLANLATVAVGDRVQVRDARIEAHRLVVDVLQAGAGDALCCPTDLVTHAWELRNDGAGVHLLRFGPSKSGANK